MAAFPFPMVLRIKCTDCGGGEDVDWTVPKAIQFMDVIVGLYHVSLVFPAIFCFCQQGLLNSLLPGTLPTAFDCKAIMKGYDK